MARQVLFLPASDPVARRWGEDGPATVDRVTDEMGRASVVHLAEILQENEEAAKKAAEEARKKKEAEANGESEEKDDEDDEPPTPQQVEALRILGDYVALAQN